MGSLDQIVFDNGLSLDLLWRGEEFLGLGSVHAGSTALRGGQRPMFVQIRTPDGFEYSDYRLTNHLVTPSGAKLEFAGHVKGGGLMEWMVHEVRPRVNTADWTAVPEYDFDTRLTLELKPVTRTIGGRQFTGFSYQYRFSSPTHPVYKIVDRGSWELGGNALGNQFWMRNCFVPSLFTVESTEQAYSTEWYIPDCANPTAFQFLPLQTELQGFTFTANPSGVLVTWATEVAHVRSLFEKPRAHDLLVHWHEHCADLSYDFVTSPVEVLFTPGELDRIELFNAYEAVREMMSETLHGQLGMRRERVKTYGQIEEWSHADLDRYRRAGLPKLLEAGVKTVYVANHFQNNMNTYGVSNFCCTVDYQVSPDVGFENLRAFCDDAKTGGAEVEMWGNTSISSLSVLLANRFGGDSNPDLGVINFPPYEGSIMEALKAAEAPFVRNPSNAIEADHYTPIFCVLNLREPVVREYWMRHWKAAHDEVGLAGIFLDSSFNLSSDKFHWVQNAKPGGFQGATADQAHLLGNHRPAKEPPAAILSQYRAHLELMTEMQKAGYVYCNEDVGVFGIHRHGPGVLSRIPSLPFWAECVGDFNVKALLKAGIEPDEIFFKGMAYRLMWSLFWDIQKDVVTFRPGSHEDECDLPKPWHYEIYKAFAEVNDLMTHRVILPNEAGVRYGTPEKQVYWVFEDLSAPLAGPSTVRNVLTGNEFERDHLVHLKKFGVYTVTLDQK